MLPAHQQQVGYVGGGPLTYVIPAGQQGTVAQPQDTFPYASHRRTGFLQILLGLAAIILQIADIILTEDFKQNLREVVKARGIRPPNWSDDRYLADYGYQQIVVDGEIYDVNDQEYMSYSIVPIFAYASTGIWTGMMFILAGSFGAAQMVERKNNRMCLRNTYLVLSILVAVIFATTLTGMASTELAIVLVYSKVSFKQAICPGLLVGVGFLEFILAIVAASICCCCSRVPTQTTVINLVSYDQQQALPTGLPGAVPGMPANFSQPMGQAHTLTLPPYNPQHVPFQQPYPSQLSPPYEQDQNKGQTGNEYQQLDTRNEYQQLQKK